MKVSWSKKAGDAVVQTSVYILDKFGQKASEDFLQEVQHVSELLENNPCLGPVEPLLAQKSKQYRSVVLNHLNKIVYYIKSDTIRIAAFWDTRREPKAQATKLR
ncbi:MAG: type II toxin-antitoxin system RelE/ParE family toxin [Bacteroidales bacterium]|nr:type II toxin-antitoxin system RelE/ParE family toxin [Bacteroidales bacterium]